MKAMKKVKTFMVLTILVFIPSGIMIWIRNHQSSGFASVELIRVFILTSPWALAVMLFAFTIIGLVHWSQGPYGMVTISIKVW
jgi:hypothetical protein